MSTDPGLPPAPVAIPDDLACPLCGYSLRGLERPLCPECGFAFTWRELLDERRDRHPYLFEHAPEPAAMSRALWTTYWRTCRPRRFWREVTPANPVRIGRLVLYAAVVALIGSLATFAPFPRGMVDVTDPDRTLLTLRALYDDLFDGGRNAPRYYGAGYVGSPWDVFLQTPTFALREPVEVGVLGPPALLIAWPGLTFASLLVFNQSMRRSNVSKLHVLRAAVYGCDFGLLMAAAAVATIPVNQDVTWPLIPLAGLFAAVGTYRLGVAYARYLRFHRPFLTVLASQVIVWLFVVTVLAMTTPVYRRF